MLQRPKVIELAHIIEADCLFCLSSGLCSNELLAITVNYMIFKSNMSNFFFYEISSFSFFLQQVRSQKCQKMSEHRT